ncbi:glutathione S-transferase family protein [Candidatus Nitrosacidococcus sp. I8]|uniref:glutathione S-transferase family protein n=1 Tax=Candidatus Nitrosacidococcus sp. I8 TaxID=2942908 RepID=UPI002226FBE7|nr:glutathione S-transferase family protein [Candidatus Nitrosacidococcus sp. I8]CAH9017871.1 Glutathione S-transferase GST-4.5 [Candidatus Nitrosacidococcus sp. I8]
MIKLYYSPGACSLASHIVLEWIGESYGAEAVKIGSPQLIKLNPAGAVPVLDTGEGWTLTQSGAILKYLTNRFPKSNLGSDGSLRGNAEFDRWLLFMTGDLHPAFYPFYFPQRYTTSKDEEDLEVVRAAARKLIAKRYELLENHLDSKDHIVGNKRTAVDAYALPMLQWGNKALKDGIKPYANLQRFHDTLVQDAQVQQVLKIEGLV